MGEGRSGVEEEAERHEAGAAEGGAVRAGAPRPEALDVPLELVLRRERLDPEDAAGEARHGREAAAEVGVPDVVDDVGADDEVERPAEAETVEVGEAAVADAPPPSPPRGGPGARVDADVAEPGPDREERGAPRRLAAADVEDAPGAPLEEVLGGGEGERRLARHEGAAQGAFPRVRVVPAGVVVGVVTLRAACGGRHGAILRESAANDAGPGEGDFSPARRPLDDNDRGESER